MQKATEALVEFIKNPYSIDNWKKQFQANSRAILAANLELYKTDITKNPKAPFTWFDIYLKHYSQFLRAEDGIKK